MRVLKVPSRIGYKVNARFPVLNTLLKHNECLKGSLVSTGKNKEKNYYDHLSKAKERSKR